MFRPVLIVLFSVFIGLVEAKPHPAEMKAKMLVTAYCPCKICCGPKAKGITASGKPVSANGGKFCAAPKDYPFGTMISVPGYNAGQAIPVYDRGGAITGDHIDVFFPTHQEAKVWGSQKLVVTVWK